MKLKFMKAVLIGTVILLLFSVNLFAQREVKSTGIGIRGTYWNMTNDATRIMYLIMESELRFRLAAAECGFISCLE